jgi:hypothetical protein
MVTVLALHRLMTDAHEHISDDVSTASMEEWCEKSAEESATFLFWSLVLKYELLILEFDRAHREKKSDLYVEVLEKVAPLFFALDHTHYVRRVPVHIRDMKSLPSAIKNAFREDGHWLVPKSGRQFSGMRIDQAHEHQNKLVKGCGDAIGLTENPTAFSRWMVSGPELARLIHDLEANVSSSVGDELDFNERHIMTTIWPSITRCKLRLRAFTQQLLDWVISFWTIFQN